MLQPKEPLERKVQLEQRRKEQREIREQLVLQPRAQPETREQPEQQRKEQRETREQLAQRLKERLGIKEQLEQQPKARKVKQVLKEPQDPRVLKVHNGSLPLVLQRLHRQILMINILTLTTARCTGGTEVVGTPQVI